MNHLGIPSFIENLNEQASEYAELYHLPDTYVWYVIGAAWHTVGMSSSMIPEYLDSMRESYSDVRTRLETRDDTTER
jgi:hypothetical protein